MKACLKRYKEASALDTFVWSLRDRDKVKILETTQLDNSFGQLAVEGVEALAEPKKPCSVSVDMIEVRLKKSCKELTS